MTVDTKKYLDFVSGVSACSLGHCHPKVTRAIRKQSKRTYSSYRRSKWQR